MYDHDYDIIVMISIMISKSNYDIIAKLRYHSGARFQPEMNQWQGKQRLTQHLRLKHTLIVELAWVWFDTLVCITAHLAWQNCSSKSSRKEYPDWTIRISTFQPSSMYPGSAMTSTYNLIDSCTSMYLHVPQSYYCQVPPCTTAYHLVTVTAYHLVSCK